MWPRRIGAERAAFRHDAGMCHEMNPGSPVFPASIRARTTRRCVRLARLLLLASVAGCTPTFDWREVELPETPLRAEMPCRPGRFERSVTVADTPLKLFMLSCEAGGVTYGVASADVGDPTRVEPVLAGLADAARRSLNQPHGDFGAFDLPGATPFRGNAAVRLLGGRPDGTEVEESLRVFGRGTRVYQASAIGPALAAAALAPFEAGLRFDLERPEADPK
jgi:hypothetical protein